MEKLDRLLLKVLTGLVTLLCVSFASWATWATVAIFVLKQDFAVLKAANHLVAADAAPVGSPEALPKRQPSFAEPGFGRGESPLPVSPVIR